MGSWSWANLLWASDMCSEVWTPVPIYTPLLGFVSHTYAVSLTPETLIGDSGSSITICLIVQTPNFHYSFPTLPSYCNHSSCPVNLPKYAWQSEPGSCHSSLVCLDFSRSFLTSLWPSVFPLIILFAPLAKNDFSKTNLNYNMLLPSQRFFFWGGGCRGTTYKI